MADVRECIELSVPGAREYLLVIRTALGGVALLKDLTVDQLDDLRQAADEACDCLLHQTHGVQTLHLCAEEAAKGLTVSLWADFTEAKQSAPTEETTELTQAVLETLIPDVTLTTAADGTVSRIDLTLPAARR